MLTEDKITVLKSTLASSRDYLQSLPKRPSFGRHDAHGPAREYHEQICLTAEEWLSDEMTMKLQNSQLSPEYLARHMLDGIMQTPAGELPGLIQSAATLTVLRIVAGGE